PCVCASAMKLLISGRDRSNAGRSAGALGGSWAVALPVVEPVMPGAVEVPAGLAGPDVEAAAAAAVLVARVAMGLAARTPWAGRSRVLRDASNRRRTARA